MFEVGFSELLLIMVLSLVVLGPERLPKVVSQVGRWMGRARAMARQFREQLEDEATLQPASRRPAPAATPPPAATEVPTARTDDPATPDAAAGVADVAPPGGYVSVADPPRPADEPRGT
jgi:sec-independent protein translocase protein TatB